MRENQERCDGCGRFVPECSLVIDDIDDENSRCICLDCDRKKGKDVGKKNPVGRPEKPAEEQRKQLQISLSPDEAERLEKILGEMGLNRSDFVRRAMRLHWLLKMSDEQITALRVVAGIGGGDD